MVYELAFFLEMFRVYEVFFSLFFNRRTCCVFCSGTEYRGLLIMENCFIYDWLTVSFKNDVDVDCLIHVLGMTNIPWEFPSSSPHCVVCHRDPCNELKHHHMKCDDRTSSGSQILEIPMVY